MILLFFQWILKMGIEGLDKQRKGRNERVRIAVQHTGLLALESV
jgi:hypothetical protein